MPPSTAVHFEVDGVQCTENKGLINVGLNHGWARELRFPVKVHPTAPLEEKKSKVRAHVKFPACAKQAEQLAGEFLQPNCAPCVELYLLLPCSVLFSRTEVS